MRPTTCSGAFRAFTAALKNTGSRHRRVRVLDGRPAAAARSRDRLHGRDRRHDRAIFEPYITTTTTRTAARTGRTRFRVGRYFLPRPSQATPHLIVFITDGDPNEIVREDQVTYDPGNPTPAQNEYELQGAARPTTRSPSASEHPAKDRAVPNANALKAQGSHILTVAVGNGLNNQASLNRIIDVSGPDVFSGTGAFDIADDDVYRCRTSTTSRRRCARPRSSSALRR